MTIKSTFQQILKHDPCVEGWAKLLLNKGIIDQLTHDDWVDDNYIDMDGVTLPEEPFPLADILDTNDLADTLWCTRCLPEYDNLWRKYAVWCAHQVEHLMGDDRSKRALLVAWDYAEGKATEEGLWEAYVDAAYARAEVARADARAARAAATAATAATAWAAAEAEAVAFYVAEAVAAAAYARAAAEAEAVAFYVAEAVAAAAYARAETRQQQAVKLREVLETETIECPWSDENE